MVFPTTLTEELLKVLKNHSGEILPDAVINLKEITEDDSELLSPSVGIWSDFDTEAVLSADTTPLEIPVSVYAICTSEVKQTTAEAFNEALIMAVKVLKQLKRDYTLLNTQDEPELLTLNLQSHPIVILKRASSCTIQVCFTYSLLNIMEL